MIMHKFLSILSKFQHSFNSKIHILSSITSKFVYSLDNNSKIFCIFSRFFSFIYSTYVIFHIILSILTYFQIFSFHFLLHSQSISPFSSLFFCFRNYAIFLVYILHIFYFFTLYFHCINIIFICIIIILVFLLTFYLYFQLYLT